MKGKDPAPAARPDGDAELVEADSSRTPDDHRAIDAAEAKSPQPSEACEWLATKDARELLLEAPAEDEVCTQIYGGPEVATVTGTLDGEQVDATFSRENGCAVARFDAAAALWDDPQPSNGPGDDAVPPTVSEPTVSAPNAIEPDVVDDPPSAFER